MVNHFLIGLGGTGGRIIRAFRKKIYEHFRSEEPEGVNIRYLYVDSSDELMKPDDPEWKVLGRSVQLKKESQLLLRGMGLRRVLDDLSSYPGISPWLGDREQFRSILGTMGAENIFGGQKRRLGRFLFACKAAEFRQRIQSQVNDMQVGGATAVTFHVCCGLAGGTGAAAWWTWFPNFASCTHTKPTRSSSTPSCRRSTRIPTRPRKLPRQRLCCSAGIERAWRGCMASPRRLRTQRREASSPWIKPRCDGAPIDDRNAADEPSGP